MVAGTGYVISMDSITIVSILFSVVTVLVVLGGFFWAAYADGRDQEEREKQSRGAHRRFRREPK